MPDDQPDVTIEDQSDVIMERVRRINEDLKYFRGAVQAQGVGHQPPSVYAAKYVEDVEFLMGLATAAPAPAPPGKSVLETALEQDALGRTERTNR